MADFHTPTEETIAEWEQWLADRPPDIQEIAKRFRPWKLYRLSTTGQRVTVIGFDEMEDGTCAVKICVLARWNFLFFEKGVFGINPDDLEECDLPGFGDKVGFVLGREPTDEEVDAYIQHRIAQRSVERN